MLIILQELETTRNLIRLIVRHITLQEALNIVKVNGRTSTDFAITGGLIQGGPPSSVLFNVALEV